jgi:hypothetical protein
VHIEFRVDNRTEATVRWYMAGEMNNGTRKEPVFDIVESVVESEYVLKVKQFEVCLK